jgi:tetratricopeptide (TPR) repeat protein
MLTDNDIRSRDLARLAQLQNRRLMDQLGSPVKSVVFPGGGGAAIDVGTQPSVTTSSYTGAPSYTRAVAHDFINSGLAYLNKADYDQAISDFGQAIALNPDSAVVHYARGLAYRAKADFDQAIADFNRATEIDPTDAHAYENRGLAYLMKADYDRAIADYSEAIRLNPKDAAALFWRGEVKRRKGDSAGGELDMAAAKAIDPNVGY